MTVAKFCPECGTATNGAKFCPECGAATSITGSAPPVSDVPPPPPMDDDERELWRGTPDPMLSPMAARTTTYLLTTERLKISSGLLGRRLEQVELYRVRDIKVNKSLTQRARKRGDVLVASADATAPVLTLESIADPDSFAEMLRRQVADARKRRGVVAREEF
jgi:hypothetical protein